jgi:chromosome partitioning protein
LSLISINAFTAAERVVVPVKPEIASLKGLELLLGTIESMKALNSNVTVAGFLITMYDKRRKSTAETIEKITSIANFNTVYIYKSRIRATASGAAMSGNPYSSNVPVSEDYKAFIDEFINAELSEPLII